MLKFLEIIKKWMPVLVVASFLVLPLLAHAANVTTPPTVTRTFDESGVVGIIEKAVNFLLYISAAIAVIFVVIAGLRYIFSGGNSEKAGEARSMLYNGLIGLVIVIAAYIIVNSVVKIFTDFIR